VARDGAYGWSTELHHLWPLNFRATTRALLLSSHQSAPTISKKHGKRLSRLRQGLMRSSAMEAQQLEQPGLGAVPSDVLLNIIRLSAAPMSAWL
jgi:hypothetical protein